MILLMSGSACGDRNFASLSTQPQPGWLTKIRAENICLVYCSSARMGARQLLEGCRSLVTVKHRPRLAIINFLWVQALPFFPDRSFSPLSMPLPGLPCCQVVPSYSLGPLWECCYFTQWFPGGYADETFLY